MAWADKRVSGASIKNVDVWQSGDSKNGTDYCGAFAFQLIGGGR